MTWNKNILNELPTDGEVILSGDSRLETYSEDTMFHGSPDAVLIARDDQEISEVLRFCNGNKIPVTFCGSQTSMTGASVPTEGLLISTERLSGIIDVIKSGNEATAIIRPGTLVADVQKKLDDLDYFYPVAPTSRDECRIGANVATNATGEDSYKYGPVRKYVSEIEIILADGSRQTLKRSADEKISIERNKAGYFTDWKNPIDLIIGSEGTLAYISRIALKLLPKASPFFSGLIPFSSNWDALNYVIELTLNNDSLSPRTLELIDNGALNYMREAVGFPQIPEDIKSFLYIKQEYKNEDERDSWMTMWFDNLKKILPSEFLDWIMIALTQQQREEFRLWRHKIPETANEHGRKYWKNGGGKIGSDWWAPLTKIHEMMEYFYSVANATGLYYMGYAHIGAGHPHTNFLAKNSTEKQKALDALTSCCKKAVSLGGGVAGEHGIGKIHADQLPIQHPQNVIEKMKSWKRQYDPNWILGQGNIFG